MSEIVYAVNPQLEESALIRLRDRAWGGNTDPAYPRILARSLVYVAAFAGDRLIGFANVATDGGLHAFLLDPTVDPEFRRRGIGTQLVVLASREARARGCEWLHVDFETQLTPFYNAAGFRQTAAGVMRLESTALLPQPDLLTARLRLRAFVAADAPAVQALAGERQIADTTLTIPHPYPDGAAEAWIQAHGPAWERRARVSYAITDADGSLLGAVGLALTPAHASAELGYWIAVPAWGRGYATEAATALCDFAFSSLGTYRIQARHLVRNPGSGRVMQKLGMRLEGTLRGAVRKWDRFEDLALYAVLAPEWKRGAARAP